MTSLNADFGQKVLNVGNSLKFLKFVTFKRKLQTKAPNTSISMFPKHTMFDIQNYDFLIGIKNLKNDF